MATPDEPNESTGLQRGKVFLYLVVAAGAGVLVGLFIIAPMVPDTEAHLPNEIKERKIDVVGFTKPDNGEALLPVKIIKESDVVDKGLNSIGTKAWENTYLLFDQESVTALGEDFDTSKVEASLSFAVMNGEGEVVEIKKAEVGDEVIDIESDHRWVLIMKTAVMNEFGIKVGSQLLMNTLPGS